MIRPGFLLSILSCTSAMAQEVVWELTGVKDIVRVGLVPGGTALSGDADGDGYRDLVHVVWVWGAEVPVRELWTLSGKDGTPLRRRAADAVGYNFFTAADAGDMDGDGIGDYASMQWDQGCCRGPTIVEVRSGADDRVIWKVTNTWQSLFGRSLLGNLDLDGDGKPDLVATATESSVGVLYAYSNQGTLLYRRVSTPPLLMGYYGLWQTLAKVGDIDQDGADDFAAGGFDGSIPAHAVFVVSGRTGQVLVTGLEEQPGDNLGELVEGCGDMDGDGTPDFMGSSGAGRRGVVVVFSGKTGSVIRSWNSTTLPGLAGLGLRSTDIDQDGVPDVLSSNAGNLWILSGRDGSTFLHIKDTLDTIGTYITLLGTQPGSRFPVFAVDYQDYCPDPFNNRLAALGKVGVFRGSPAGVSAFGLSCQGTLPAAPKIGARDLGASGVRVTMHGAASRAPVVLLVGLSRTAWFGLPLPYPLSAFGLPGCSLYTSTEVALLSTAGSTGIAAGYAAFDLPTPLSPSGPNQWYVQWLSLDATTPSVAGLSDALGWKAQ